jgi:phosphohistidine phosphatase
MDILERGPIMIIHLVRHAEAVERSEDIPEEHRFLTRRGRKRFGKVASAVKKAGMNPDLILTSPLVRAVQTAEILAGKLRHKGELQVAQQLAAGLRSEGLDQLLDAHPEAAEVVLVGHEPDMGSLVQSLFGLEESCELKKGAVVSLKRVAGDREGAEFIQLVSGAGKIITSRNKAFQRLQRGRSGK